jgi:hypothetical protein
VVDFRYHVVSIIAVFLALTVGIVLGTYALNGQVLKNLKHQVNQIRHDNDGLRNHVRSLEHQQGQDRAFVSAVDPLIIEQRLAKQRVVIIQAPGASNGLTKSINGIVALAGATVTATVKVSKSWTDPAQVPLLDDLATQLVEPGVTLPSGTAYERAGLVLATALLHHPPQAPVGPSNSLTSADTTALAGLKTANLVSLSPSHPAPATLAVFVAAGAPDQPTKDDQAAATALTALARGLDLAGGGTVVVGPANADAPAGLVAAVRADNDTKKVVSTVDDADTEPGLIRIVLALAAELRDTSGQYGIGPGANAAVPSPVPAPLPSP